jgi:hypothetical protein
MADVKHTPLFIRDYGQPVELAAAECQFALLDAPDGAPVAYVYMPEDAAMFAATPDLFEAAAEFCRRVEAGEIRSKRSYAAFKAALSKATAQQEGR